MTHPGRTEGSRIDDMISKLDKINSEEEPKPAPAADFDDEMDHVLGTETKAPESTKEEPMQAQPEEKATKPAQKRSNGKKDKAPAKKAEAKSNGKGKDKDVKKDNKKAPKQAKSEAAPKRARARDPETVELQKQIVTMLKRAAGKPVAVSKIVEKLEGKGDKARDRQIRNALRGPQKDGLLAFTTVEGKKGFIKYVGA